MSKHMDTLSPSWVEERIGQVQAWNLFDFTLVLLGVLDTFVLDRFSGVLRSSDNLIANLKLGRPGFHPNQTFTLVVAYSR